MGTRAVVVVRETSVSLSRRALDPASYGPNTEIRGMLDAESFVTRDESTSTVAERQHADRGN